jgi:integrase/recombinase XerC
MHPRFEVLIISWMRALRAENRAARTLSTYQESAQQLGAFLATYGTPKAPEMVTRADVRSFITHLLETRSEATASVRFRAIRRFFAWLVDEQEITASPMDGLEGPKQSQPLVPVLSEEQLRALLRTCSSNSFTDKRDLAIMLLLMDSGGRASEIMGLTLEKLDLDHGTATVMGKGGKERRLAFGARTVQALDRYLRERAKHSRSSHPNLWLGANRGGPMTNSGLRQLLERRGDRAGVAGLHPHVFRHSFAHHWLASGGAEGDLMQLAGWSSPAMLRRYGKSAAEARAQDSHKRHGLADRL